MNKQFTEKIKCWGIVQGVGFRPFVVRLADRFGLKGQVLNIGGLVEIQLTDTVENIDRFIETLKKEKPEPAEIVHIKRERTEFIPFEGFTILDSDEGDDEAAMIPADLSICPECLKELKNPENPRYNHPFISCMVCGPRYTIIDKIPYDRENTAMLEFPMCEFCRREYSDRLDRRFHAQTISCHHCGPQLELTRGEGDPVEVAAEHLKQGGIIGFKGVGGYNLVCDPLNDSAVEKLRQAKGREEKPFAVMFKDVETVKKYCQVSPVEENLIQSSARPILLLEKDSRHCPECAEFEKSRFIGSFLPSMGGQVLLLEKFGGPLIMTSANVSSLPMIKDDREMADFMESSGGLIDETVTSRRRINVRIDDSVARIIDGQPQMIRRSKGYTPVPLYINPGEKKPGKDLMILAAGGQLKNSFALSKGPFSYLSQYFGDLDTVENCTLYEENIERMKALFRIHPSVVACDLHPLYNSTSMAKKYAEKHGVPVIEVQHHHAHVASVMAEHGINEPVIGVSFDGTGYGTDGKIWGGEILLCHKEKVERLSHLKYVKMIGGDSSMKEGWKSAMCYASQPEETGKNGIGPETSSDSEASEEFEVDISELVRNSGIEEFEGWATVKAALEHGVNTIESSSMGRLFDAVSSLLGICQENKYEGQCAILLEDAAARGIKAPGNSVKDDLALAFHHKVANTILEQCLKFSEKTGVRKIALTGGVFQNKILMEESLRLLRSKEFEVFYNISVSPNDGGIALGQNYIAMHQMLLK